MEKMIHISEPKIRLRALLML